MTLNGIPWNPVLAAPGIVFAAPLPGTADEWRRILMEDYKINTTLRREKGQEISGACGQLVVDDKRMADIEDLCAGPPSNMLSGVLVGGGAGCG